ncbi:MAG: glycosyltransferase, partial [Bacteroidota bacterium]
TEGHNSTIFRAFERLKEHYAPDLLLLDTDAIGFAMVAYYLQIKVVLFSEIIQSDQQSGLPPFYSRHLPQSTVGSQVRIRWEWTKLFAKKQAYYLYDVWLRGRPDPYHKTLANLCGFPRKEHAHTRKEWYYRLDNFPNLILYPQELDYPRREVPANYYYAGAMLDTERVEKHLDRGVFPNDNPIVYCALGTLTEAYTDTYLSFLCRVMQVAAQQPEINLVIAVGAEELRAQLPVPTSNVQVYDFVPQLQMLQRAQLMITHGGMNSIKECIHYGVPMLVYPLHKLSEQQGNAARVVYHGMGLQGGLDEDSEETISNSIKAVLKESKYRISVRKMQQVFHNYRAKEQEVVEFIESHLAEEIHVFNFAKPTGT